MESIRAPVAHTRVRARRPLAERLARATLYGTIFAAPWHVYRRPLGPLNVSFFRLGFGLLLLFVMAEVARRPRALRQAARRLKWAAIATGGFLAFGVLERSRSDTGLGTTVLGQQVIFFASVVVLAAAVLLWDVPWASLRRVFLSSAALPYLLAIEQWIRGTSSQSLPFQSLIGDRGGLDLLRSGGYSMSGIRPAATFSDPNFLGVFCAIVLAVADQHRQQAAGLERVAATLFELGSLVVLVLCGSRTGLVAVGAYIAMRLLQLTRHASRRPKLVVGIVLVGMAMVSTLAVITLASRGTSSLSSERHVEMELTALGVGLAHPAAGIGLANLGPLLAQPADRSSANSLPFTLFAEEGVIGLALAAVALGVPALGAAGRTAERREAAFAFTLAVAIWFYDFVFVLDVAALWWALLMVSVARQEPSAIQRPEPEPAAPLTPSVRPVPS